MYPTHRGVFIYLIICPRITQSTNSPTPPLSPFPPLPLSSLSPTGEKLLRYLSNMAVNGPDPSLGATGQPPTITTPTIPKLPLPRSPPPVFSSTSSGGGGGGGKKNGAPPPAPYLRNIFVKQGEIVLLLWRGDGRV